MDNVLDPVDQSMFDLGQAVGVTMVAQGVWVYNRGIDIEGLRRFHDHLQRGRLSRRIERSPLGFGRHRWISPNGSSAIEIVASARPREEFNAWLNEQANTTLDCEHGPVWHLAVLPFTDGGAGVSLVIPHCVTDGVGMLEALEDAALGRGDPISWPAGASRRRWQAVREDATQTVRDVPAIGRAVVASVRLARNSRNGARAAAPAPTALPALPAGADEPFAVPLATIFVDAGEWDARAHSIGGTSNALLVGLAAQLAQRRGRVTADGLVTIRIPVNERTAGDTRGNAVGNVDITVDPAPVTTDLREIRAAIKQGLNRHLEVPDDERAVWSVLPLLPKRLIKFRGSNATGVVASNLGVINPAASRADGTEAEYFAVQMRYAGVTKAMLDQFGGLQIVASGRVRGQVFVMALAYQAGRPDSDDGLLYDLSSALKDFSLTGTHL
jgi:diacylglycerol O-acyltransferase / wax synthase